MADDWTPVQQAAPAGGDGDWAPVDVAPAAAKPAPSTSLEGMAASAGRGAAPYAAGAAIGAAAGAPFGGVGAIPGAMAGAGAVGLTQAATSVYNMVAPHLGWSTTATPKEMSDKVLDKLGVKRPSTDVERVTEATAGGAADALSGAAGAKFVEGILPAGTAKEVAGTLAQGPVRQGISGATGGAAAQTAAEMGAGPVGQAVAGLVGGAVPYGTTGVKASVAFSAPKPQTELKAAVEKGYSFPPAEIADKEHADPISGGLAAAAGKIKLQQAAATKNQQVTNALVAKHLGLPPRTPLTEQAFKQAQAAPAAVYEEVRQAVPEVTLSRDFRDLAREVGGRDSLVEKYFPSSAPSPEIRSVRQELDNLVTQHGGTLPIDVAMKKVADWRGDAFNNLKAAGPGSQISHRLGLAQRQAADLIEDQIGESVKNAASYFDKKAIKIWQDAGQARTDLNNAHQRFQAASLRNQQYGGQNVRAAAAYQQAQQDLRAAMARHNQAEAALQNQAPLFAARGAARLANQARLSELPQAFKDARKRFAEIFDVKGATNRSTGDVSALGLGKLYAKGKPMTGDLKVIADAANAAPKSMQIPSQFGHSEDWSALDFFGVMGSVAHGNPGVGAAIAARPLLRGWQLRPSYQQSLIKQYPGVSPLPLLTDPGAMNTVDPTLQGATSGMRQ